MGNVTNGSGGCGNDTAEAPLVPSEFSVHLTEKAIPAVEYSSGRAAVDRVASEPSARGF